MELIAAAKRVWSQPEKPMRVRVRPASDVGIVLARWKCNLGLALFAWGLRHLCILNPARQVGESALSIVTEQMARTPNRTLIDVTERGPRIYTSEAVFVLALAALVILGVSWVLYVLGLIPFGHSPGNEVRTHIVDPILHRTEGRPG